MARKCKAQQYFTALRTTLKAELCDKDRIPLITVASSTPSQGPSENNNEAQFPELGRLISFCCCCLSCVHKGRNLKAEEKENIMYIIVAEK